MAFLVLAIGVVFIVVAIGVFKMHPFLALILAAAIVGLLSPIPLTATEETAEANKQARIELLVELSRKFPAAANPPGDTPPDKLTLRHLSEAGRQEFHTRFRERRWQIQEEWLTDEESGRTKPGGQGVLALELTAREFGSTAGGIGIVIVLAAIIGFCMMESGAADKITRRFLAVLGEKRAGIALLGSGYVLSVPVFFDTVFFLLVPLARALGMRTGKNYVMYVMAICAGGAITHSLVPPTPGPVVMVETLQGLEMGTAIFLGFLLGLLPAFSGLFFARVMDRRLSIPLREAPGVSNDELQEIVSRKESQLPGFSASILPVILPVILITGNAALEELAKAGVVSPSDSVLDACAFAGNKNFALLLATALAVIVLVKQKGMDLLHLKERIEPAVMSAGVIILITSAGGAFGKMLARTGISEALHQEGGALGAPTLVIMAWVIAAVMKVAQGSGTVSMITTSGIMAAILQGGGTLPCHMIYIFAAIGFGSGVGSWMNDSGFWVVCKMGGLTEKETLATWTPLLAIMGVVGLIQVLVLCVLFPMV